MTVSQCVPVGGCDVRAAVQLQNLVHFSVNNLVPATGGESVWRMQGIQAGQRALELQPAQGGDPRQHAAHAPGP